VNTVFIDGQAGTTGLEIASRLRPRDDIKLVEISEADRKDPKQRKALYNEADVVILCLPDNAAREAVALAPATRFIDASTAHRVSKGWVYGLPELEDDARAAIASARLVSNPGCYPIGFLLSVRPLIDADVLDTGVPLRINAVSGYSGGGKSLISQYEACDLQGWRSRPYALHLDHKHVPEMHRFSRTDRIPLFVPTVGHFYKGMLTHVPLFRCELKNGATAVDVHNILASRYAKEPFVRVLALGAESAQEGGFIDATTCNDTNRIELMIFASDEHLQLTARYDNLGKGASGAAVQNMNLMLGLAENTGLVG
jgi:N-acetyl-gamma-glutamyl-phosphate reductase